MNQLGPDALAKLANSQAPLKPNGVGNKQILAPIKKSASLVSPTSGSSQSHMNLSKAATVPGSILNSNDRARSPVLQKPDMVKLRSQEAPRGPIKHSTVASLHSQPSIASLGGKASVTSLGGNPRSFSVGPRVGPNIPSSLAQNRQPSVIEGPSLSHSQRMPSVAGAVGVDAPKKTSRPLPGHAFSAKMRDHSAGVFPSLGGNKNRSVSVKGLAQRASVRRKFTNDAVPDGLKQKQDGSAEEVVVKEDLPKRNLGEGYNMFTDGWVREKVIGRGQFGIVSMARNTRTNEKMAVKHVRIDSVAMLQQMIDEIVLMCRASFRNINVVNCMGWSITDSGAVEASGDSELCRMKIEDLGTAGAIGKQFNIFMEFVEKGSIASQLEKHGPFSEIIMRNYARQLLLGIRSLHAAGIAHRDIKCQNLLLTEENILKVADFGCAKKVSDGGKDSIIGSVPWMPPEVIREEVNQLNGWKQADIWSVGCTIIEMISGSSPWNNHSNPAAMMFAIASSKSSPPIPDSATRIHEDGVDFISACCKIKPEERTSIAKLIYHPYMRVENVNRDGMYERKNK